MKSKKTIIIVIVGLIVGSFVISGSLSSLTKGGAGGENTKAAVFELNLSEEEKLVKEYQEERNEKIKNLVKKDLYGDVVSEGEYGIVDDTSTVDVEQLLPTDEWKEFLFDEVNLVFRYPNIEPKEWWVQGVNGSDNFIMTTSQSGEPETNSDWAKIKFGLYERTLEQSIFDWMESPTEKEGEEAPPSNHTVQYVLIGESNFLGSMFFKENTWTGQKNVYAEVSETLIFAASLEIENSVSNSEFVGKFDQVFYTMLESLEVKRKEKE